MTVEKLHLCGLTSDDNRFIMSFTPHGMSPSPRDFTIPMCAFLRSLIMHYGDVFVKDELERIFAFLDDIASSADTKAEFSSQLALILVMGDMLGLKFSWKKVDLPHSIQTILGIVYDCIKKRVSINKEKI